MELFELKIDDELLDEVFAISLVSEPAIESNFVFFDKEKVQFQKIDNEKRIVAGPVLIPNKTRKVHTKAIYHAQLKKVS